MSQFFKRSCISGLALALMLVPLSARPVHAAIPIAPTLNSATPGNSQVTLNWTKVSGAKNYSVKYGTASGVYTTTINLGNVSTHSVTGLVNGTTYYFVVTATSNSGTSPDSNERSATPQIPPPVPLAPTLLNATPGNAQVSLNWSASANATSYTVKYGTRSGQHRTNVNAGNATSLTVTGLTNGKIYYFVVTASNSSGESPKSNQLSATPVAVIPNNAPQVNAGLDGSISVTGTHNLDASVSDDGLPNPPGAVTTAWTKISGPGAVTFGNASAVDTAVSFSAAGIYVLRLTADDSQLSAFDEVSITTDPLAAPNLISATPGNTQVSLNWSAVAQASGYTVKFGTTSGSYSNTIDAGNVTNFDVTGLTNGTVYYFVVSAYNGSIESGNSNELSATPSVPIATYGPDQCHGGTSSASSCHLGCASTNSHTRAFDDIKNVNDIWATAASPTGWLQYEFATPKTIVKYEINARLLLEGNPKNWTFEAFDEILSQWIVLDTRSNQTSWTFGTTKIFTFSNFNAYTQYRLNISANNGHVDVGLPELDMMEYATTGVPFAITDLQAVPGNAEATLTWSEPGNGGAAIINYEVQYGTLPSGTFGSTFVDDATPGATITGLTNDVAYQFRVVAHNALGASNPSNVATATPFSWTPVSGPINTNTTWSFNNSPFIVTGNVTVASGVTLTIEPGVEVRFSGNYKIEGTGTINAQGTSGNMIVFTSGQASPAPGNWQYVALQNTGSIFNYVKVEYSDRGVYTPSDSGTPAIQNSLIQFNNIGIYFEPNTGPIILNNTIANNVKGIFAGCNSFTGCHPTINNNAIYDNTEYNLFSSNYGTNASNTTINAESNWWGSADPDIVVNTHFDHLDSGSLAKVDFQPFLDGPNGNPVPVTVVYGAVTTNTTWSAANNPYVVVVNTTVSSGVTLTIEPGVVVKFGTNDTLTVNGILNAQGTSGNLITFTSNQAAPTPGAWVSVILNSTQAAALQYCKFEYAQRGLSLVNSSTPVEYSIFENNQKGIFIHKSSSPSIQHNSMTNNTQHGIEVASEDSTQPRPTINFNSILNNGGYNLLMSFTGINVDHSGSTINAELNWWGTTDSVQIAAKIFDYNDNNLRPHVDFVPYLLGTPDENLTITNNSISSPYLNIRAAVSTNINYSLNLDANITIEISDFYTGSLVRTLLDNQSRLMGGHTESWDLRNDSNQPVPPGVYVYRIVAAAGTGSGAIYGPIVWPANDPVIANGSVMPSGAFSPSKGERMAISFDLDAPAFVSVGFEENEFISDVALNAGPNTLTWDGWGTAGLLSFYQNNLSVDAVAQKVPATAIILDAGTTLDIPEARTNPYVIRPLYNDFTTISYTLNEPVATVTVSVLTPDGATVVKVLENTSLKAAGSYELTWDGRDTGGNVIVNEGFYRIRIEAVDLFGSSVKRDVSLRILY